MTEDITQGARAGRNFPAEEETYDDPASGATVRRLTSDPDGDYHLYFTEDGWYDEGRRLLFRSDRTGSRQLFSIDLETGLITQVTDLDGFRGGTAVDQEDDVAYFRVDDGVGRLDLDTLRVEGPLYEAPEGFSLGSFDVSADGDRLYVAVGEDVDVDHREQGLAAVFEAEPRTRIHAVPLDGGDPELLVEADVWASSHVNASPTRPELFTYCEEGPWDRVENRIWAVDAETDDRWRVREVPPAGGVGHEYWLQGGERVGYHGAQADPTGRDSAADPEPFAGSSRYDDTDRREATLPDEIHAVTHTHANSTDLIVCDGSPETVPYGLLFRWDEAAEEYEGPRILATYDWRSGSPHPHSRFSPDGETVAFDSARYEGSSDLYLVEVPPFEELPAYESGE